MRTHPVADLFPLLAENSEQFRSMVQSIREKGLLNPIVLDAEGQILDGRNRLAACKAAAVEPRFIHLGDMPHINGTSAGDYAFDVNFSRRDLTEDQRVAICAAFDEFRFRSGGGRAGNCNAKKNDRSEIEPVVSVTKPKTRDLLATKARVSTYKAQQALTVKKAAPELMPKVRAGELSLRAAEISALGQEVRRKPHLSSERRAPQIKALVESGHNVDQIARDLDIGDQQVRSLIRKLGLPKPVGFSTKGRLIRVDIVAEQTVSSLLGLAQGIETIKGSDFNAISPHQAEQMLVDLRVSTKAITWFTQQLKERANV